MSYHLALRSLQRSCLAPGVGGFSDCIVHSLSGEHPAWRVQQQMQLSTTKRLTATSICDRMSELLAVDLNPVGSVFRLTHHEATYIKAWDFFNSRGNVVASVGYESKKSADIHDIHDLHWMSVHSSLGDRISVASSHEKVVDSLRSVLSMQLRKNQNPSLQWQRAHDSKVSTVARIFRMDSLVLELSEYFEAFPADKVSHACLSLGIHPRAAERRVRDLGLTIVMIKQACMLARATHEILWSDRPLGDIAARCGYTHGAHLSSTVSQATGGMSPSYLRSLMKA